MTEPPKASKQAVALAYEQGEFAPRVVAKGRGVVAEQMAVRFSDLSDR